jgi:arylsulfatase
LSDRIFPATSIQYEISKLRDEDRMTSTPDRPNILFIMDDQHRHDYLGAAGASWVNTPAIDSLAARGLRFTHCTTNSPICAPSRIALATGLQADRVAPMDNASYLSHRVPTYYQRLRDHSYRVGCVGKLDLGKPDPYDGRNGDRPVVFSWGFTHPVECEGKIHAGRSKTPQGPYNYYLQELGLLDAFVDDYTERMAPIKEPLDFVAAKWIETGSGDSVLPTEAFEDCYIGRRAVQWIREIPDDFPWHLFVSFVGPHDPYDPPTEYADRYRDAEMPPAIEDGWIDKPEWIKHRSSKRDPQNTDMVRRQYCAAIEAIDDQVGLILEALEERGMLDNTIILFASDHGEMLADHGMYMKSTAYEPSLRVPLIVAGPGISEGAESDALVELIDVNPTLCELAGLAPQENIDARSFAPLLKGEADQHRSDTISSMHNFRCIRTHTHKFIESYNDLPELYDLVADPNELTNIVGREPELVRSLRSRLSRRMNEGKWLR